MTGAVALRDSYAQFDAAIGQMVSSLSSLAENMTTLKNGIDALTAQYQTLNTGILEYTGAVGQITSGYGQICQEQQRLPTEPQICTMERRDWSVV